MELGGWGGSMREHRSIDRKSVPTAAAPSHDWARDAAHGFCVEMLVNQKNPSPSQFWVSDVWPINSVQQTCGLFSNEGSFNKDHRVWTKEGVFTGIFIIYLRGFSNTRCYHRDRAIWRLLCWNEGLIMWFKSNPTILIDYIHLNCQPNKLG